jgi:drug/metabolite transporter (DMT)-like permease
MGILGKLAYDDGATVGTLLAVRSTVAAALFWGLVLATNGRPPLRALGVRGAGAGLALGACGYALQAGCSTVGAVGLFFASLRRTGPTTAAILATVEPVVAVLLAFVAFGERLAPVQVAGGALVLAS